MTPIEYLKTFRITAIIESTGKITLKGLSGLPEELWGEVVSWAKEHRAEIEDDLNRHGGCLARCKQSGLCYGTAYFDGKPGRGTICDLTRCAWNKKG